MKTIKNMLYIAAIATAITACSGEESLAPEASDPITVSAIIPGDVWATASRAAGEKYSDWALYYTSYKGVAATYSPSVTVTDGVAGFTTGTNLVWEQIDATQSMHLTCKTDNGTADNADDDYTLHVSVPRATPRADLTFGTMKPVVAKFTVNFKFVNNLGADADHFTFTFSAQGAAAYNAATHGGVCPASSTDAVTSFQTLTETTGANTNTITGTILLPEQTLGNTLTVTYNHGTDDTADDFTWTVNLSTVPVGSSQQMANQLIAGQHLTLNITASRISLDAPSIEVEAFTNGENYDLGGEAQQPSTNP